MKALVIGAGGQLGRELVAAFPGSVGLYHRGGQEQAIDITSETQVSSMIDRHKPDVIMNAAALANVDECESNPEKAYLVNGKSLKFLVEAARACGSLLVHISTDYVFDGKNGNYSEDSTPNPVNFYGLSKLIGDVYVDSYERSLVIRTSGVYGHSRNFPMFVYQRLAVSGEVQVMGGYYSPIHARNLAMAIKECVMNDINGVLNIAAERISRKDLAVAIADAFGLDRRLIKPASTIGVMKARRPYDSSLNIEKAKEMISWDFYTVQSNLDQMKLTMGKEPL